MGVYKVTTTNDSGLDATVVPYGNAPDLTDGQGLSLREAVLLANRSYSSDQITFDESLAGQTITLKSGQLDLTESDGITIDGDSQITISGDNASRIFSNFGKATLEGLILIEGQAAGDGGAVRNSGNLTLTNSTVEDSKATDYGGGIANFGNLTLTNSTISGNEASRDGGGVLNEGTLILTNSTVEESKATDYGGGIANIGQGDLSLIDSTVSGNEASRDGGGIANFASLEVTNSIIKDNHSEGGGYYGGGGILNGGTLTLTDATVSENTAGGYGGGGIANIPEGDLSLIDSTVSGNEASRDGGGILNNGTLKLTDSTVSENTAGYGGGGIVNFGLTIGYDQADSILTNSTVSNNSAANGGGIFFPFGSGNLYLQNVTVSDNHGGGIKGPDNASLARGSITLANSLIANSTGGADFSYSDRDTLIALKGVNLVQDGSLVTGPSYRPPILLPGGSIPDAVIINGDPKLGPLAENGGPTKTHALLAGSPAIDVASSFNGATIPATDQRGVGRPIDGDSDGTAIADLGAFEAPEDTTPANEPPMAIDDTASTAFETVVSIDVLGNDSDSDGSIVPGTLEVSNPSNGTAEVENGNVVYTPAPGFQGEDSFTYTVEDDEGALSNQATVTVEVTGPFAGMFELVRSWNGGYQAKVVVENISSEPINAWTLTIDGLDENGGRITSGWINGLNAGVNKTILDAGAIEFSTVDRNYFDTVEPGERFSAFVNVQNSSFGDDKLDFEFTSLSEDAGPVPDADGGSDDGNTFLEVSPEVGNDWGSGFTGRIRVENISDQPVDDWAITLGFDKEVSLRNVWNATPSPVDDDSINFKALNWNEVISPGQSFNFGFNGNPGGLGTPGITLEEITIA